MFKPERIRIFGLQRRIQVFAPKGPRPETEKSPGDQSVPNTSFAPLLWKCIIFPRVFFSILLVCGEISWELAHRNLQLQVPCLTKILVIV